MSLRKALAKAPRIIGLGVLYFFVGFILYLVIGFLALFGHDILYPDSPLDPLEGDQITNAAMVIAAAITIYLIYLRHIKKPKK